VLMQDLQIQLIGPPVRIRARTTLGAMGDGTLRGFRHVFLRLWRGMLWPTDSSAAGPVRGIDPFEWLKSRFSIVRWPCADASLFRIGVPMCSRGRRWAGSPSSAGYGDPLAFSMTMPGGSFAASIR